MLNRNIYDPLKHGVTQSLLTTYRQCPTKARLYLNGYYTEHTSRALIWGTLFHEALDWIYSEIINGGKEIINNNLTSFLHKKFTAYLAQVKQTKNLAEIDLTLRCWAQVSVMVEAYYNYHELILNKQNVYTPISTEDVFKFPLNTSAGVINFIGKKDRVVTDAQDNLYLWETKTKSRFNLTNLQQSLKVDLQCQVYCLSLMREYGIRPKGILYDVIKTPDERTSPEKLEAECLARPDFYFSLITHEIQDVDLSHAETILKLELADFINWWNKSPSLDYMYSGSCLNVYGACQNLNFCSSGKQDLSGYDIRDSLFSELTSGLKNE